MLTNPDRITLNWRPFSKTNTTQLFNDERGMPFCSIMGGLEVDLVSPRTREYHHNRNGSPVKAGQLTYVGRYIDPVNGTIYPGKMNLRKKEFWYVDDEEKSTQKMVSAKNGSVFELLAYS